MGFPWKKGKSTTRISQMVKDQFHNRKNATSPLVVETGFPTSLVDLIVNHRDRFKKPSSSPRFKKKKPLPSPLGTDDPPFVPPSQSPLPPPAPSPTPLPPTSPLSSPPRSPIPITGAHEIDDAGISGGGHGAVSEEGGQEGAYSNKVLVAVLKIFPLVVLALGAKKFAVGITMSAFLLFFLDYLARNVFRYEHLVPCPEVREKLRLMVLEVRRFIISRVVRLEEAPQKDESLELPPGSSQFEEIQAVQPRCYLEPPIENVVDRKEETDDPSYCAKNFRPEGIKSMAELIEEDEEICELPESKNGKSRRAKIKSKMKKLFPKRIGNTRKTGKDLKLEINPTGEGEFPTVEENECPEYPERGLEPDSMAMNTPSDVKGTFSAISCSLELPVAVVEKSAVSKSDFVEREKNSGYLFLVLVALIGLVMGGRVYALLLTLTWCFLSKSGGAIRRSIKVS